MWGIINESVILLICWNLILFGKLFGLFVREMLVCKECIVLIVWVGLFVINLILIFG